MSVNSEVGRTNKVQLRIDIQQAAPIKQPPQWLPGSRCEEVHKLLVEQHVIERAHGSWASQFSGMEEGWEYLFLCRLPQAQHCDRERCTPTAPNRRHLGCPQRSAVIFYHGSSQWILASGSRSHRQGKKCLLNSIWPVPVLGNALWSLQFPKHFLTSNGASAKWTSVGKLFCLSGWHYHLQPYSKATCTKVEASVW